MVLVVLGWAIFHDPGIDTHPGNLGGSHLDAPLDKWSQPFSNMASVSSKGLVNQGSTRAFAIRVVSDTAITTPIYFQLYNLATISKGFSVGQTPVVSFKLPVATASASQVLNLDSSFFSPALRFQTGLVWTLSSSLNVYASVSVVPSKYQVHGLWNQAE